MLAYIERMVQEKNELVDRIEKAVNFLEKENSPLNDEQKRMLSEQVEAMKSYEKTLSSRIDYETTKTGGN